MVGAGKGGTKKKKFPTGKPTIGMKEAITKDITIS